jgi:dolichol-phosphate mannosyltransferase
MNCARKKSNGPQAELPGSVIRYLQFCLVGSSGIAVDMIVLFVLTSQFGLNLTLSKSVAAEIAIGNNFIWNDLWTFRGISARTNTHWLSRFARFNAICAAGMLISMILLQVQVGFFEWNIYISNFVAILLVSVWNFSINLRWGGREKAKIVGLVHSHPSQLEDPLG